MSDASKAVFLSYASEDAEAAQRICGALRAAGVEVWFDQSELVGGDAWDQKIRRQIKECALFMPVISANTQARAEGYFRLEWRLADQRTLLMGRSHAFLLPVCIDDTDDANADVPDSFLAVQWTWLAGGQVPSDFVIRTRQLLDPAALQPPSPGRATARSTSRVTEKTVAVLAFANLSHRPENEMFSDGISEELLNVLAKVPGLRVTARTSAFFFKGRNLPVAEIARRLGVAYVVEGSVRQAGNRVRIAAQLIDADGFHVWSETYDRELQDIFALQDEVARDIAKNFQITVEAIDDRGTVNPEVHRLVLQGRHAWNQFSEEGFHDAEAAFAKALEIEPKCATASEGLALVACRRAILSTAASRFLTSTLAQAEQHARQALHCDASLAEPHAVLGMVSVMRGQLEEAGKSFRRALRLNPNSDLSLVYHARLLQRQGRPDLAVPELEDAHRLSPLVGAFTGHRATALIASRRAAEALAVLDEVEHLGAGSPWTRALAGLALAQLGRKEEAILRARSALENGPRHEWTRGFTAFTDGLAAWALAEAGARHDAEAVVRRLLDESEAHRMSAGFALATLGRHAEALGLLESTPEWLVDHVMFCGDQNEPLRADPRFHDLLRKLDAVEGFATLQKTLEQMSAKK